MDQDKIPATHGGDEHTGGGDDGPRAERRHTLSALTGQTMRGRAREIFDQHRRRR